MSRAWSICSTPGCPNATPPGKSRCDSCNKAADKARGTATERGYNGAGHKRFRAAVLRRDPICVLCHVRPSTVADHHPLSRRELLEQGFDPDDPSRGRGLCKPCHDSQTGYNQPGGWNRAQQA